MPEILWIVAVVAAFVVGWFVGRRGGGAEGDAASAERSDQRLRALAGELAAGDLPTTGPDAPPAMAEVRRALERRWALKDEERERALREALGRIAAFLREGVRDPLREALSEGPEAREAAMETAVGAVKDLEFFLREPLTPDETHDLTPVVQQVAREFTQDWDVSVRVRAQQQPVRTHIHKDGFMDAVYLLLHNAGQFGADGAVDIEVTEEDGRARVVVRDRGPGFTPEALERAPDLFYTTTESGLGLGIPFARRIVESYGGSLELRNADEGGAEVRLTLPAE